MGDNRRISKKVTEWRQVLTSRWDLHDRQIHCVGRAYLNTVTHRAERGEAPRPRRIGVNEEEARVKGGRPPVNRAENILSNVCPLLGGAGEKGSDAARKDEQNMAISNRRDSHGAWKGKSTAMTGVQQEGLRGGFAQDRSHGYGEAWGVFHT